MTDNLQSKPKTRNNWLQCQGSSRKLHRSVRLSPDLSSAAARLLLIFWWAPLQRIFEEGFEDKVTPVFACLCEFLHAVESMWRQARNNGLSTQAGTVIEQKFILTVASTRPADMNAVLLFGYASSSTTICWRYSLEK